MTKQNFWDQRVKEGAVLNRVDRISEVLFGLIMVLTFTGAISASGDGKNEVRELLWAALGCNLAWGFVDAIMYLMSTYIERGHSIRIIQSLQKSTNKNRDRETFRNEVQPFFSSLMSVEEIDEINNRIKKLPAPTYSKLFTWNDLIAGIQIFLLVFLCTFPVALPFALADKIPHALRISNGIALLMLFVGGYKLADYAGLNKWITAIVYTGIGLFLVALTIALGG